MNEHEKAIKAARDIVDYCKSRKCECCVFYNVKGTTCLVRYLADFNWQSMPETTFKEVEMNLSEIERRTNK